MRPVKWAKVVERRAPLLRATCSREYQDSKGNRRSSGYDERIALVLFLCQIQVRWKMRRGPVALSKCRLSSSGRFLDGAP